MLIMNFSINLALVNIYVSTLQFHYSILKLQYHFNYISQIVKIYYEKVERYKFLFNLQKTATY